MILDTQNKIQDTVRLERLRKPRADAPVKHVFHTMEQLGASGGKGEGRQLLSFVIALVICFALYGLLYLAMHLQS